MDHVIRQFYKVLSGNALELLWYFLIFRGIIYITAKHAKQLGSFDICADY